MEKRPEARLPLVVGELVLRRIGPADARDLLEYRSHPEVARYQYWEPQTAERIADVIDLQSQVRVGDPGPPLVLAVVMGGKVIGDCQLTITSPEHGQAEVGFTFHHQF